MVNMGEGERMGGEGADPAEVAKFAAMAADWWNPDGPFRPLHRLNPLRLRYVRDRLCALFGRDARELRPLQGLRLLDVGCGGGLLCEPLARMGARVTGIDATGENIAIARDHAKAMGLRIDYQVMTAEDMVTDGGEFDAVSALEVIEHVPDPEAFVTSCVALTRPGGGLALSTLNRTAAGFLLGIVAPEYILGWLPRGSHDWRKFIRPRELARWLAAHGMDLQHVQGAVYHPLQDEFRLSRRNHSVNYLGFAARPAVPDG